MRTDCWAQWCGCIHNHTRWEDQTYSLGDTETPRVLIANPRNTRQVRLVCDQCQHSTGALPNWLVCELMDGWRTVMIRERWIDYPACTYKGCDQAGVEEHHFSPRNTFGDDADNWPTAPLCQAHHRGWHQTMDGYRWHKKRGVA